jgi:sugar lactone lactonase YvrE
MGGAEKYISRKDARNTFHAAIAKKYIRTQRIEKHLNNCYLQASLLYRSENMLAEGPLWHPGLQSFFWVDIDGKSVHQYTWPGGMTRRWPLDYRVSLVVACVNDDRLLLGLQGGLAYFDLLTEKLDWLMDLEKDIASNRPNDGGCDPAGRLWIGTMDSACRPGCGSLYSLDPDLGLQKQLGNISVSNGIAWSLSGDRMYYTDSPTQQVQSFVFDQGTGHIQFEKIAITVDKEAGSPDGMCLDEAGMLWIAQWNGFGVYRWNPLTGTLLDKIEVPVPQVSSCAFGGPEMDQLFITTARENMTPEQIREFPLSGNIFIARPGVKGIPVHKFGK